MVTRMKLACATYECPIQACFLMKAAEQSPINHSLAEFAWIIKNWARPLGLLCLASCPANGDGNDFSLEIDQRRSLASDNLVQDLKLGLDLAATGHALVFIPKLSVQANFHNLRRAQTLQRQRWIQGQLTMIRLAPKLLITAIITPQLAFIGPRDGLGSPSYYLMFLIFSNNLDLLAGLASIAAGGGTVAVISVFNLLGLTGALYLVLGESARELISLRKYCLIAAQVCRRLPVYFGILRRAKSDFLDKNRPFKGSVVEIFIPSNFMQDRGDDRRKSGSFQMPIALS